MSQAAATKLISKLRFKIHDRRRLRNVDGPRGRHEKIKKTLTALLKHERIEMNYHRADETRGYAERLISEAIRNGDLHKETMEMASYWITEPPIVHKLFKVLAPRYSTSSQSYTKLWRAPNIYPGHGRPKCILELRNNIYPSLEPDKSCNKNLIHNVLLEEAKKVYWKNKAERAANVPAMEQRIISEEAKKVYGKNKIERAINIAAMEQRLISESEARKSEPKEKIQSETAISAESSLGAGDSELPSEASTSENLKADSASKGESEVKSKVDLPLEADLDKMKISEEKSKETLSEDDKK